MSEPKVAPPTLPGGSVLMSEERDQLWTILGPSGRPAAVLAELEAWWEEQYDFEPDDAIAYKITLVIGAIRAARLLAEEFSRVR